MPTPPIPWLERLDRLRVDRDEEKGRAPHKPLLLLAVLDLWEAGGLRDGWVELGPELILRFQNFWPIVAERRRNRGDIRMPFHALGTDGVWAVFDREGRPSQARDTSVRAQVNGELLQCLADPGFREQARQQLITRYFHPAEQVALNAALGFEADAKHILAEKPQEFRRARDTGRSARFKNLVVGGYRFTCALTGYRLVTSNQAGIVEAAHIHALCDSRNNDPRNGLALTPTAHALFDLGLWSVGDDLRNLVQPAAAFEETPDGGFSLRALAGRPLQFVAGAGLRPGREHLAWHRRQHGFSSVAVSG